MLATQRAECSAPQSVLSVAHVGSVSVVAVNFAVIRERQAQLLERPLSDIVDMARGKLAMDLSQVGSFSCAWINSLISLTRRCRSQGGDLVLFAMDSASSRTLRDTGLLSHLTLERDKLAALRRLGEEPAGGWRLAIARMLDLPVAIPEAATMPAPALPDSTRKAA